MKITVALFVSFSFVFSSACSEQREPESFSSKAASAGDTQALRDAPSEAQQGSTRADDLIRFYQGRLERNPNEATLYTRLAEAYIQRARVTGDTDHFEAAERALKRGLAIDANSYSTLLYMGQVKSADHDFKEAAGASGRSPGP